MVHPMPFKIDIPCPIAGCGKVTKNTGALGTHLRYEHDITDDEYRRELIKEQKQRILGGKEPLSISLDDEDTIEDTAEHDTDDYTYMPDSGIITVFEPSPKIEQMVSEMDDYIEMGEAGFKARELEMRATTRPITIHLSPEVLLFYDYARRRGFKYSISEFIRQCVVYFFLDRGVGLAVVRVKGNG